MDYLVSPSESVVPLIRLTDWCVDGGYSSISLASQAMSLVVEAVTRCRFESTDTRKDEVIYMKCLHV
jgi:hypothetical protein